MKNKLLDKNYILNNGIDYDELEVDYDRFGDKEFIICEGKEIFFSGLTSESKYEYGICLTSKEWDEEGSLIKEKTGPSEDELNLRDSQEKWYKEVIKREKSEY
jgi:hypothetical protein